LIPKAEILDMRRNWGFPKKSNLYFYLEDKKYNLESINKQFKLYGNGVSIVLKRRSVRILPSLHNSSFKEGIQFISSS
jgi:hypothetical protein